MTAKVKSLGDTVDASPYEYYEEVRAQGDLVWDDGINGWVASTYASVKEIFTDEDRFARPSPFDVAGEVGPLIFSPKHTSGLYGEEHMIHRKWWLGLFRPKSVEDYRERVMVPVIESALARFEGRGTAELVGEYTSYISARVIAGVLGLPWDNDPWMAEMATHLARIEHFKGTIYLKPDSVETQKALDAVDAVNALMKPYMDEAKATDNGTMLSRLWRDEALQGWTDAEVCGLARTFFGAGNDTTRTAMANALYLVFTTPGLREKLLAGDRKTMASFVEESLRLYGTVHFRARRVLKDTEVQGCPVMKGDTIASVMSAGDRDEAQFPDASSVDLERPNQRMHLAFGAGIGACAGMALARAELLEGLLMILHRLPDIALDPDAEQPEMRGFLFKMMMPLNVTFSPVS